MSNPCIPSTNCINGNCPGCRNGTSYCNDPRCYPNCVNCTTSVPNNNNWIIITIILVLLGVLLVLGFIIGYDWFFARKKASEPKNITINKVIPPSSIAPPSIPYVSQVPMSVPMAVESSTVEVSPSSCGTTSKMVESTTTTTAFSPVFKPQSSLSPNMNVPSSIEGLN